jgi:hypothetical protein
MNEVRTLEDIFPSLQPGDMLKTELPSRYVQDAQAADPDRWH